VDVSTDWAWQTSQRNIGALADVGQSDILKKVNKKGNDTSSGFTVQRLEEHENRDHLGNLYIGAIQRYPGSCRYSIAFWRFIST
jgi:hypothetical protein